MNYFQKRALEVEEQSFLTSEAYKRKIKKLYKDSQKLIEADIAEFYNKYADKDGLMSFQDAKKMLTPIELQEYKTMMLDRFDLNLNERAKISRLESLLGQVRYEQENMFKQQISLFEDAMTEIYKNSYYQNIYTVQSGVGMSFQFDVLDTEAISKIMSYKSDEMTFSARIWGTRKKLFSEVQRSLAIGIARGQGNREIAKEIAKRYDVSLSNANRLVRTESNFYHGQAQYDAYTECDAEWYEIIATLDGRTSQICREMDGKTFMVKDAIVGVNYNPFHPNCRTTTGIYIPDITTYSERIKRNKEGKSVTGDYMSYKEWVKENNV